MNEPAYIPDAQVTSDKKDFLKTKASCISKYFQIYPKCLRGAIALECISLNQY